MHGVNGSCLTDLHRSAGARLTDSPGPGGDPPLLLTYGDVPGEYRAGTEGALLFDQTDFGRLAVDGSDATAFLHRLLANDVKGLESGTGNRNLLLSSKGKIEHAFDLSPAPGGGDRPGYRLTTAPGGAAPLATALDMYLFTDDVEIQDLSASFAPLALCGPQAKAAIRAVLGMDPPEVPHRPVPASGPAGDVLVVGTEVAGSPGWRLETTPEGATGLWTALREAGASPGGLVARDALRVEAGQALFGTDIDGSIYPQEARQEEAFSLDKGCYIGQEVVAKIDTYGGLNKCLFGLSVDHDDPVPPGTRLLRELEGEVRDLGVVTSWSYSFVLDTGLVLAYIKRKHQDLGTTFQLGESGGQAKIVEMPLWPGALPFTGGPPSDS